MKTFILSLVVALTLTIVLHGPTTAHSWLADMFSDNVPIVELYEDGSGIAIDNEGHKITFCVENMPCDNSVFVFLPSMAKGN